MMTLECQSFELLTEQDNDMFVVVEGHFFKVHPNQFLHWLFVPVFWNWLALELWLQYANSTKYTQMNYNEQLLYKAYMAL